MVNMYDIEVIFSVVTLFGVCYKTCSSLTFINYPTIAQTPERVKEDLDKSDSQTRSDQICWFNLVIINTKRM